MTVDQLIQNLKKQIYHPVYLLDGEESYYIDMISDFLEEHVLTETEREFNQTILYGKDVDAATIIGYAKRYPMMANYHVVIVKEAQEVRDLESLIPYVLQPLSSTLLVICHKYGKVDRRKSLSKAVEKAGILFESPRIYENKIPAWIDQFVKSLNYSITEKAGLLLTEFLGNDLSRIAGEIKKLTINIPPGKLIDEHSIEKYIGISKDFNVFELQKALGNRQIFKANQIIFYFADNPRDNPLVKVIPILYSYFSKLLIYQSLADKSRIHVASTLGIRPFFVTDYEKAARNYPLSKLKVIISILREYDLKSKGIGNVSASDGDLMKEMVYRILHT